MSERKAIITIHPPKKKIQFNIPEDLHVDDVIGTCLAMAALLTGMKTNKPSLDDHDYIANVGFEKELDGLNTSLEKVLETLYMIDYDYKFRNKQKHMSYSSGCAISTGYTVGNDGYVYINTRFDESLNEWLEGKTSIAEAIKANFHDV